MTTPVPATVRSHGARQPPVPATHQTHGRRHHDEPDDRCVDCDGDGRRKPQLLDRHQRQIRNAANIVAISNAAPEISGAVSTSP